MARALTMPNPQDKVGKKIDYLAARLGQALAEHGFKRTGRNCVATVGEGVQRHWQIINLQAGKWNSDSGGEFYVNVALQFPAVIEVLAKAPGAAWRNELIDKPDEAAGQMRARLDQLAPSPTEGEPVAGAETGGRINGESNLADMADQLISTVQRSALPWLQCHAHLEAVRDHTESLMTSTVDNRIAAALVLDDIAGAQRLLERNRRHLESLQETALATKRQWLSAWPLDLSVLPHDPAPRAPDSWTLKQEAKAKAETELHEAEAGALRASFDDSAPDPSSLAQAWIAEYRARWRGDPDALGDLPSGQHAAALTDPQREELLLALMQQLALKEDGRPISFIPEAKVFELDEFVEPLVKALLPTLPAIGEAHAQRLFETLDRLVARINHDLITGHYPWAFADLVAWLDKAARPHREALKPDVQRWLKRFSQTTVARYQQIGEETQRELAKPLDPNSTFFDSMVESRAQMQARTQSDNTDVLRRLSEYPEQCLAADDKQAVRTLRHWLRRDALTDRLLLAFEPDDWGGPTQQAWDALQPALRQVLRPTIEWLAETAENKPSKRWLVTLDQYRAMVPESEATTWRDWLLQRLQSFDQTEGLTEWATTGARPGVGAKLGETSEAVLTGLLWWAWRDTAIPRERLAPVLQTTALAAWRRLEGTGARAPGIGALALQILASCGPAGRDWVAAQAKLSKKKQFQRAVEQALAKPLT